MTTIWTAMMLLGHGLAGAPPAPESASVLVLELQAPAQPATLAQAAQTLAPALAEALARQPGLRVVTAADLAQLGALAEARDLLSCQADSACLARIAAAGAARWVLSGSLGQVGTQLVLNLVLVDGAQAVPRGRLSETADSAEALLARLPRLVARLLAAGPSAATPGSTSADAAAYAAADAGHGSSQASYRLPAGVCSFAVFDLGANGVTAEVARNLTLILSTEIKKLEGTTVISRADIAAMLQLEQHKDMLGCSDDLACMAEIGGALGVDRLVVGQVGLLDTTYIVSLQLIDPGAARVDHRVSESFRGQPDELIRAVRHAGRLLLGLRDEQPGTLAISASVPQALVYVDEVERGALPLPPMSGLRAGRHSLRVTADGHFDWQAEVYVDPGDTSAVWVSLSERPLAWWQTWWVWTIVGAVALGAGSLSIWAATSTPRGVGSVTADGF